MTDRPPPVERNTDIPSVTVDRSGRGLGGLVKPAVVLALAAGLAVGSTSLLLSGEGGNGVLQQVQRAVEEVFNRATFPAPGSTRSTPNTSTTSGDALDRLHAAIASGDRDALDALLTQVPASDLDTPLGGKTALMNAATAGRAGMVERLLRAGAGPNARGSHQRTALQYAAEKNRKRIAGLLLDAGADMDGVDSGSLSPLIMAADRDFTTLALMLIERGANVNIQNVDGWTALMDAAEVGNVALVEALLAAGAEPGARHRNGWTAVDFARKGNHDEVMALLDPDGKPAATRKVTTVTRPAMSTNIPASDEPSLPPKKGTRQ